MKRAIILFTILAGSIGCTKEEVHPNSGNMVEREFVASLEESTKTSVDAAGKVNWSKGDAIRYYTRTGEDANIYFVPTDCHSVSFKATVGSEDTFIIASNTSSLCDRNEDEATLVFSNSAQRGDFGNAHISVCKRYFKNGNVLNFQNITSIIRFSLKRTDVYSVVLTANDGTIIGGSDINVTFSGESVSSVKFYEERSNSICIYEKKEGGGTFYFSTLPCVINGFTLVFLDKNNNMLGLTESSNTLTLKPNGIIDLGVLDSRIKPNPTPKDLSKNGTANCYIVPREKYKSYKFKATRGNSTSVITGISSVDILWESYGGSKKPEKYSIIKRNSVSYSDNYITFAVADNDPRYNPGRGNAVIAARDEKGDILWSWHIWITDTPGEQTYNGHTFLDRNLGVTANIFGLLYQWGRKDPFLGANEDGNGIATCSGTEWSLETNGENRNVAFSIKNPTKFIRGTDEVCDWLSTPDETLWGSGSSKTIYDPCPAGYRVPENRSWSDFSSKTVTVNEPFIFLKSSPDVRYPASSSRSWKYGTLHDDCSRGYYWSCSCTPSYAYEFYFDIHKSPIDVSSSSLFVRAEGCSVRCVSESSFPILKPVVTTSPVSAITESSSFCGGKVISDGGGATERGVVWSTSQYPTITSCDGKTTDGTGVGSFTSRLTGLTAFTVYYVRAYATNSVGTSYGEQMSFTTQCSGPATDLSASGTANCYIVPQAGKYKFKATVKGGTSESVGTPSSAEVLWETFNTNVTPKVGDIVSKVSYSDGYITFSTTPSLNNGNAVIAVKNASGIILWSWHIWVCGGYNPEATAQDYYNGAGTMMDRNLGATSATAQDVHALGLLYEWGRKDPFLSGSQISFSYEEPEQAKSTGTWPSSIESTSSTGTLSYVEKHPMQFIEKNSLNKDWYYTGSSSNDNTRWQTSENDKGKYDPCPPGWRVPDGGSNGIWSKALGSSSPSSSYGIWCNTGTDLYKLGNYYEIWYPAAGIISDDFKGVGKNGYYWSCTPKDTEVYRLCFNSDYILPSASNVRACAISVRCQKE